MNEFIEKNKRLLRTYCVAARIIGWVLLFKGGIFIISILTGYSCVSSSMPFAETIIFFDPVLTGFMALGVAQFIKYLFETANKPGWILRYIDKILYLNALFLIVTGIGFLYFQNVKMMANAGPYYSQWRSFAGNALPVVARALILAGLGQILRRVMPVIEESKTLV